MADSAVGGLNLLGTQEQFSQITISPYRAIGAIIANGTFEEVHTDTLEITDQPIDQGASVSDHAFKRPAEVTVKLGFTNSAPSSGGVGGPSGFATQSTLSGASVLQIQDVYQQLLEIQQAREFVDVYTGKRVYTDMLIKQMVVKTDVRTENMLDITLDLKQVFRVATRLIQSSAPIEDQEYPEITNPEIDYGTKQLSSEVPTFDPVAAAAAIDPLSGGTVDPTTPEGLSIRLSEAVAQLAGLVPFEIPVNGRRQTFSVVLSGQDSTITIGWNPQAGAFILDILGQNQEPKILGLQLATGSDLLSQFEYLGIPGSLLVQTAGNPGALPTPDNFGVLSHLYYVAKEG